MSSDPFRLSVALTMNETRKYAISSSVLCSLNCNGWLNLLLSDDVLKADPTIHSLAGIKTVKLPRPREVSLFQLIKLADKKQANFMTKTTAFPRLTNEG
jgi:hypothetical protein